MHTKGLLLIGALLVALAASAPQRVGDQPPLVILDALMCQPSWQLRALIQSFPSGLGLTEMFW